MRRLIAPAGLLENLPPSVLVLGQHLADETARFVRGLAALRGRPALDRRLVGLLIGRRIAIEDFRAADQQARIDAERPADKPKHHDGADADAAADRHTETA